MDLIAETGAGAGVVFGEEACLADGVAFAAAAGPGRKKISRALNPAGAAAGES